MLAVEVWGPLVEKETDVYVCQSYDDARRIHEAARKMIYKKMVSGTETKN